MAGFITRLLSRFQSQNPSAKSDKSHSRKLRRRRLHVEQMEMRRLMVGDLASIAGNVFTDLLDDGYDPNNPPAVVGDPGIAGVTVNLYQDDGNGTFGPEDAPPIATTTTDANGNYRFDGLTADPASPPDPAASLLYFVEQEAATGRLQRTTESVKSVTVTPEMSLGVPTLTIDDFNTTPVSTTPTPLSAGPGLTVGDQVATAANEAIGGERDILINNTTGLGGQDLEVSVNGGLLSLNPGAGVTGNVIVSYDGIDGSADTLDHTSLGPLDLTANDGEAFHFLVGSEAGNTLTVTVFSGSGAFSSTTVPLAVTVGGVATEELIIPFADIDTDTGGGADFSAVTAIRFEIDISSGADAQVNFTQIVAPDVTELNFANLTPMSLGNLVFNDANNNGLRDGGESGVSGVRVELYQDTNLSGDFDAGDAAGGSAQTTDADGNYLFTNLFPGEYVVLIPNSQFTTGNPLFGFLTSNGNDPAPDPDIVVVDGDDNGALIVGVGVASAAITLASGTEPTNDGDTDPDSNLTLDFGFAPQIDLAVTKTSDVTTTPAGTQIVYTIQVSNIGAATATNVVVTDDLPDLLPDDLSIDQVLATNGNVTTQPGVPNAEILVGYPSLAPAQTETITITVTIPATAAAAAAITNTVSIVGDGIDTNLANNTATRDVAITRQAALTLTKTDSPDPNTIGGTLTYEIVVANTGPSTANNVVVSDTLPNGLSFDEVTTTNGTASQSNGVITANIPSLGVGQSTTITVVTTIETTFAGSTIPNSATASADDAPTVVANAETTVNPQLDLSIAKSDSVDPVNRGSQLTYTMVVNNAGPSGATNVEVVDTLPAGVTFVSATGGTVTPPAGDNTVLINVGDVASGGSATVTITVDVGQAAPASFTNTAVVLSTETIAGFDIDTTNNSDSETTATQALIDLAITKTDSVDPAVPGQALTYTLVVTNNGPSDATAVRVTDNLPDGIQINSATSDVGSVTIPPSAQDTNPSNADDLVVNIGSLANGATATIVVNATILAATTGTLTNVANVTSTDATLVEDNTANNTATETTTLTPQIDLRITKVDSVDPVAAGNALTYTIVVTNDGPSTATNVNLSDTLPAGVTFTSAASTQGTVTNNAGVITGALGSLAPAASATVTIIVGVDATTRGTISNTASVTATQTETNTQNNSATAETQVNASVDLAITKTDSVDPVAAGGSLSYTILVTNNGPSTATNVVMTDTLPAGLTFNNGTSTLGTVTNAGNAVTANVGTLASGASATITLNATVSATATGTLSNTASVTSTEADTNTANNSATQSTALAELGSIAGVVYLDLNNNGIRDGADTGIPDVSIALTGTDLQGQNVSRSTTTDASGNYIFDDLLPGTYQLVQTQPEGLRNGASNVGTGASGTAGENQITNIVLNSGVDATAFNFGELRAQLSKRRFLASSDATA